MNRIPGQTFEQKTVRTLRRWRWLILTIGALTSLLLELWEDPTLDLDLIVEALVYVVIFPVGLWILLTVLANNIERRAKREHKLRQHRRFAQQLAHYHGWDELTRFVAKFPTTLAPIEHASLFVYDHPNARLEFVDEWNVALQTGSPIHRYLTESPICQACLLSKSPQLRHTAICTFAHGLSRVQDTDEYCLPLSYDRLLVGILRMKCRPGQKPTPDQFDLMNAVSSEIALALALSIVQPRQMTEVRVKAQLDERRRIAYDLHDSLAQQMGYLHLGLDRLSGDAELLDVDKIRQELAYMRDVARDAYEQVRSNLTVLRTWEATDLEQAIANYAQAIGRHAKLEIELTTAGEPLQLPFELRQQIFSLVREGLRNIEQHAQARRVQIALDWSADELRMGLTDDGSGFNASAIDQDGHYGLAMMQEQVADLQGELKIESKLGHGSQLTFRIPLRDLKVRSNNRAVLPVDQTSSA